MRAPQFIAIPALIGHELTRQTLRGARSGILYTWRYRGSPPAGFRQIPESIRPAEPEHAEQYYCGHFHLAGVSVFASAVSPFEMDDQDLDWRSELHGFRWLRHLQAADTRLARIHGRGLVGDWIGLWNDEFKSSAWNFETTAQRLISWLTHAHLIGATGKGEHADAVMRSIGRHLRYLRTNLAAAPHGRPRLLTVIALAFCSLILTGREKTIRGAARDLDRELSRQIFPDGGHISRNPAFLLDLLADLLPLRDLYMDGGVALPAQLQPTIDRIHAALHFFSHSNGELAQFNGTGATPHSLMRAVMRRCEGAPKPVRSAIFSGYERLAANDTVVLMDTGKPESRRSARRSMGGTLSFELSCAKTRFITNCGVTEARREAYAAYFRTTAAHSTATIDNTSSSKFVMPGRLRSMLPSPLLHAPKHVDAHRSDNDAYQHVVASHDGYGPEFGIVHERELFLSSDGTELNGIDRFTTIGGGHKPRDIAIRFHLPPDISSSHLASGHSVLMAGPTGDAWTMTCIDAPMQLEESLYFSGPGKPRKTQQIVISTNSRDHGEVRWSMSYCEAKKGRKRAAAMNKTPDLLDGLQMAELETQD
ncbi:MAG: heparinase II/III family protein [Ahrensia sp.]|nr:heparinase II/III family protein [Ahrensia sp.]